MNTIRTIQWIQINYKRVRGFLLTELLLATAISLVLLGQIAQITLHEIGRMRYVGRILRERALTLRALELMRSELQSASVILPITSPAGHPNCDLGDRKIILHLQTAAGHITYSVASKPSALWRPEVLMRCGPSYGLDGQLKSGTISSRVVLDSLAPKGVTINKISDGRQILIIIQRRFFDSDHDVKYFKSTIIVPALGLTQDLLLQP